MDSADIIFRELAAERAGQLEGGYRVEDDRLSTIVDSAWLPAWVGTEQPRTFRRDGDTLMLMTNFQEYPMYRGRRTRGVLLWRKE
jgi:hypothetical protein